MIYLGYFFHITPLRELFMDSKQSMNVIYLLEIILVWKLLNMEIKIINVEIEL